jgi:hypothetical protein
MHTACFNHRWSSLSVSKTPLLLPVISIFWDMPSTMLQLHTTIMGTTHQHRTHGRSPKIEHKGRSTAVSRHLKVTNVGRNMQCAYTSHVEDILNFKKLLKALKSKSYVRQLITNRNKFVLSLSPFNISWGKVAGVWLQHFDVSNVCVRVCNSMVKKYRFSRVYIPAIHFDSNSGWGSMGRRFSRFELDSSSGCGSLGRRFSRVSGWCHRLLQATSSTMVGDRKVPVVLYKTMN